MSWSPSAIPDQSGRTMIVTGANSGIGYEAALALAKAGARVILACRSETKGFDAAARINAAAPGKAVFEGLDLANLASIHGFAARIKDKHGAIDVLINNAGVMSLPRRTLTADGFEMQIGVNFLGHYALTGLLLPALMKAPAPRVIQLASIAHRRGRIDFDNFQGERSYRPWLTYNQTKLAMLMFALELQRRSDAGGWGLISLAAHPGIARTELVANGPGPSGLMAFLLALGGPFVTQSAAAGAWPTELAATAPDVTPGGYYGPTGFMEFRGPAGVAKPEPQALDRTVAARLWDLAETLTKVTIIPGL